MCRNRRAHSAGLTSQNWHSRIPGFGEKTHLAHLLSSSRTQRVLPLHRRRCCQRCWFAALVFHNLEKKTNELQCESVLRKMIRIPLLTSSSWERYSLWRAARSRSACSRNQSKSGKWETLEKTGTMQRIFDYDRIRDLSNWNKASHCCLFLAFGWILNNGRWLTK